MIELLGAIGCSGCIECLYVLLKGVFVGEATGVGSDPVFLGGIGFLETLDGFVETRLAGGGEDDFGALLECCFGYAETDAWDGMRNDVLGRSLRYLSTDRKIPQ